MRSMMGKAAFQRYAHDTEEQMRCLYRQLSEKEKRRYAALEAEKLGHGGQRYICRILGCSPTTMRVGRKELHQGFFTHKERIRRPGGGRKKIRDTMEGIDEMFLQMVGEYTAESPRDEDVKWTNLSVRAVSRAFQERGYPLSDHVVKQLFKKHGYVKRKMQTTKIVKEAEQQKEPFEKRKV
ncbi:MAG TPA: hypothetical protein VGF67_31625 [Ktedonobacteraceae bacterium]|jgi:hypothetical protein